MQELTRSQKARLAIREFKILADALALRGFYSVSGRFGKSLEKCLKDLSPEIYGSMNDPRVVELKGLEYIIDRLPKGIEKASRIILTDEDQFEGTPFENIRPLKRRRLSYKINNEEICFIISRGLSEIYDILTHMTFLNIEAQKIFSKMLDGQGRPRIEWNELETCVTEQCEMDAGKMDSALWNLSIIIGRPYHETKETFDYFEQTRKAYESNNGLFSIIYHLGERIRKEQTSEDNAPVVYLTPSLINVIGQQRYGKRWAQNLKETLCDLKMQTRPLHIISANLHSVLNTVYAWAALKDDCNVTASPAAHDFFSSIKEKNDDIVRYAEKNGLYRIPDLSGANIDCQLIDTAALDGIDLHPDFGIAAPASSDTAPVLLVIDYAFGIQAFEIMEQILKLFSEKEENRFTTIGSISIMGKAGILPGRKGDIMLATAHVCEGSSDNYILENDLSAADFSEDVTVFEGPMATVLGTSLQNRDVLEMFMSDWNAVGLEMEGGHYQKAINAAVIKGYIPKETRIRYAYYASDNPLETGNTLAAGAMGNEGIKPTYLITRILLEKIWQQEHP